MILILYAVFNYSFGDSRIPIFAVRRFNDLINQILCIWAHKHLQVAYRYSYSFGLESLQVIRLSDQYVYLPHPEHVETQELHQLASAVPASLLSLICFPVPVPICFQRSV